MPRAIGRPRPLAIRIATHQCGLLDDVSFDRAIDLLAVQTGRNISLGVESVQVEKVPVCAFGRLRAAVARFAKSVYSLACPFGSRGVFGWRSSRPLVSGARP